MIPGSTPIDLDAYFVRIGHDGPRVPTLETLRALHLRHPLAIAFENLDPLLGRVVALDLASLVAKLVRGGRGGYCYEHNLLFGHVLAALGFRVTGLAARVLWGRPEGAVTPRSHMVLRVDLADGPWIADVGFGGMTLTAPLQLAAGCAQATPHEDFRLVEAAGYLRLEARVGGAWTALYRFDLAEQVQADYEVSSWFLCTHPGSHFRTGLMAARVTPEGRLTLANQRLTVHRTGGTSETRDLAGAAEIVEVLAERFGIALPDRAAVAGALGRMVGD